MPPRQQGRRRARWVPRGWGGPAAQGPRGRAGRLSVAFSGANTYLGAGAPPCVHMMLPLAPPSFVNKLRGGGVHCIEGWGGRYGGGGRGSTTS